jgi:hypothetical protein
MRMGRCSRALTHEFSGEGRARAVEARAGSDGVYVTAAAPPGRNHPPALIGVQGTVSVPMQSLTQGVHSAPPPMTHD